MEVRRLRDLLEEQGRTQKWLARRVGIRDTRLSKYMRGWCRCPLDIAKRIANVVQWPLEYLVIEDADAPGPARKKRAS